MSAAGRHRVQGCPCYASSQADRRYTGKAKRKEELKAAKRLRTVAVAGGVDAEMAEMAPTS